MALSLFTGLKIEDKMRKKEFSSLNQALKAFEANSKNVELGIFDHKSMKYTDIVSLYDKLEKEEWKANNKRLFSNAAEEILEWTKENILWDFPVDNEQYMDEEKNVSFHEHVFLDHHLTKFPDKGPIRHFMELVLVGLSKNSHLSVKEKLAHIDWFKTYFENEQKQFH